MSLRANVTQKLAGATFCAAAFLSAGSADAAESPEWRFEVMPYVWASGFSGTLRPFTGAPTFSVSKSFSETLEDLDAAFFMSAAAERGRFVALGDFSHVATSKSGTVGPGVPATGSTEQTTLTLAGGYRAFADSRSSVDVFAGVRAFWLEADVAVAGGAFAASPQRTFIDPVIGARASRRLAERWSGGLHADFGGFGAGTDLTVVAAGMINFHATKRITLSAGYRSMWIDYNNASTIADVVIGGPLFGVSWRF